MEPPEIAERLRAHHERTFQRYLVAERALVIADALGATDAKLIATRDAAQRVAAGYAELVAEAERASR
jgi:hypothetical protein